MAPPSYRCADFADAAERLARSGRILVAMLRPLGPLMLGADAAAVNVKPACGSDADMQEPPGRLALQRAARRPSRPLAGLPNALKSVG